MQTILSMKDRIRFKIADVEFTLKPLNTLEQNQISSNKKMEAGVEIEDTLMSAFAYVKFAVKDIKGPKLSDGTDYKLEFEGDYLTDDCVSEIFTLNLGVDFYHAVQALRFNQVFEPLTYLGTKKKLKGVELEVISAGDRTK
jgi:hypothetical protein